VAESPDGLRLRSGLLSTRAQTVPPGRVQAVRVAQPLLWRRSGWYRVSLNVAGSGHREGERSGVVLLPVAPYPVVRQLLGRVLPGADVDAVALVPAPRAARWRAPLQHPRLACGSDDQVFVSRGGRLVRRVDVVPHARTQSVRVTQGPWQRLLGLASTHVDSTPGPVRPAARQRAALDARAVAEAQLAHAAAARLGFRPERWARSNPPTTEVP
jgi:putative membrane protein